MPDKNIYQEHGYFNRREYLLGLADEYGVRGAEVIALANLLGPTEDFDGLVSAVQDIAE